MNPRAAEKNVTGAATPNARLTIDRLGERGEGVARSADGLVFVPYALAGETILAEVDGPRGKLTEVIRPSPHRIGSFCRYFSQCGGCAVQNLAPEGYAEWKRELAVNALRRAGLTAEVSGLIDAHGDGRRRATFHGRFANGRTAAGFMQARAHEIVAIESCPLLAPSMRGALPAARALVEALGPSPKPLDILVTAMPSGLDVDLRGHGPLDESKTQALVQVAFAHHLARLSNHGSILISQRTPAIIVGRATVALPPGAFLQATEAGEQALAARIPAHTEGAARIADLFCGIGTFALRLAQAATVDAFDSDELALSALAKAARIQGLREVKVSRRDLFRRPLGPKELDPYDAVVFDPPRAGAENQAKALAASAVPIVVAVSCNPKTFARDAAILHAGGYEIARIEPIDQFRHSPHVEIIVCLRRRAQRPRKSRLLLG